MIIEDGILSMAAHAIGMDDAPTFQKFGKTHFVSTRNFYVDAKRNADWDDWVCHGLATLQDKDNEKKEEKDDYTWIPCSVRFPTGRDDYTVTIENFHGERSIDTRFYWGDKNFETAADAQYHVKVVAWVPNRNLEPWKGDAKS